MKTVHTLLLTFVTPLPLLFQDVIIPIAIRKNSTLNAPSIIIPGLERTSTTELLRHTGAPLTSAFYIAVVNGASSSSFHAT